MVTLLGRGVLRLQSSAGEQSGTGAGLKRFNIEGGFLQVADDVVRLVTEQASPADGQLAARGAVA
jgi:F-type H+-transporting ATPase subunit epsilon